VVRRPQRRAAMIVFPFNGSHAQRAAGPDGQVASAEEG
jgi:hypothetical protein